MQVKRGLLLAAAAAALLPACSTTSVASTPIESRPDPTLATTTTISTTVPPTDEPTTSTVAPTTTAAPTTTVAPTTTTTVPANVIAVAPVDPPLVGVGTRDGEATKFAQQRLLELGFWLRAADGDYDLTTSQAVMAFQKYVGITKDGVLGDETAAALSAVTTRPRGKADAGNLVEIDKSLQLLFFVIDGKTEWILNTSTGSEIPYDEEDKNTPGERQTGDSVTRNGLHDVYRERAEGWWEGDLGEIYRPKYFSGGEAVHGSNHIPAYAASHGCVRVSVPAMDWIWENDLMPMHLPVWVHGEIPPR